MMAILAISLCFQFKWEVKEAKPILRHLGTRDVPPNVVTSHNSSSQEHLENNGYDYDDQFAKQGGRSLLFWE